MTTVQRDPSQDPGQRDRDEADRTDAGNRQPGGPDTQRDDGPVGAPGVNDDSEGRGEDEGKGQNQDQDQDPLAGEEQRTDAQGRNPGEPGFGEDDARPDDATPGAPTTNDR